jgi:hypothetical protein
MRRAEVARAVGCVVEVPVTAGGDVTATTATERPAGLDDASDAGALSLMAAAVAALRRRASGTGTTRSTSHLRLDGVGSAIPVPRRDGRLAADLTAAGPLVFGQASRHHSPKTIGERKPQNGSGWRPATEDRSGRGALASRRAPPNRRRPKFFVDIWPCSHWDAHRVGLMDGARAGQANRSDRADVRGRASAPGG